MRVQKFEKNQIRWSFEVSNGLMAGSSTRNSKTRTLERPKTGIQLPPKMVPTQILYCILDRTFT